LPSFVSDEDVVGFSSAVTTSGRLSRNPIMKLHLASVVRFIEHLL
jgi:hypothetical protein